MRKTVWKGLFLASIACLLLVARSGAQEVPSDVYTEMIDGEEYRISPGEKSGTWQVSYGEETFLWEPKPYYDDELVKAGPKLYLRWAKPGLPYPWELSVQERIELARTNPGELLDRYTAGGYFFAFGNTMADVAWSVLVAPSGFERTKILQEWGQSYVPEGHNWENLADGEKGVVSRKYIYIYREPNEVRGLGGRTINFVSHDRRPDEWLYLPSVRKVRRLSSAASQDYLPGSLAHFEQISHTQALPDVDYKFIGLEICKGPPGDVYGYGVETIKTPTWSDGSLQKTFDGNGDLCIVIEATPKPGLSWWYAKRRIRYGVHFSYIFNEDCYDKNGERIQTWVQRPLPPPTEVRQKHPYYYVHWGQTFIDELNTGFKNDFWQEVQPYWDLDFPPWLFNQDTLLQEPTNILFW